MTTISKSGLSVTMMIKTFFLSLKTVFVVKAQEPPRNYIAYQTVDTIQIDGMANETSWEKALWTDNYIDIEGDKTPAYSTKMKMLYDEEYLYFYAEMEEPHVWATLKQRDTVIFYNNDFEIFIDPDGDTHNYYEFEMNALNTLWDLFLTKPYRNHGKIIDSWDIQGVKTAVRIDGTLNDPKDIDKGWSVEIAFPWKVITEASRKNGVPINEFWRINFSRVNWDYQLKDDKYSRKQDADGKFLPEYNWVWSPQWVINMHEPEHWGYLFFADGKVGKEVDFELPEDEHIKWKMYALYRKLLGAGDNFVKVKDEIDSKSLKVLDKMVAPKVERHKSGWNITVISPFSSKVLLIKEDGKFIVFER
ncbi:carbohydrate-binding family 9-like protein [Euzebyella saccharophila]|uniref:Carbohydrate-binding family 9-like protein n=1 Tax=Euzebyella saccharophila TaxID=679664 RepID=A0ABV8JL52_9FLAO|nr:carbohydrate-binding family 9-like protein [Euzebyella saccharophila]